MIPSLVYLFLSAMGLGLIMAKHGQPQGEYNIWTSLFAQILVFLLLYWGNFFDPLLGGFVGK